MPLSPGHVWKKSGPSLKSGAVTISALHPVRPGLPADGRKRIRYSGNKQTGETRLYVSPVFLFQRRAVSTASADDENRRGMAQGFCAVVLQVLRVC